MLCNKLATQFVDESHSLSPIHLAIVDYDRVIQHPKNFRKYKLLCLNIFFPSLFSCLQQSFDKASRVHGVEFDKISLLPSRQELLE